MKKKWFSALAALAVLSFAAAPMNGYAVDEESLDDELAVAVTTEAPVIAGTVVTTDTQMQTTSSSVYTTVTDEYGNGLDENGNIVPATTTVSTQTETTTTTTKLYRAQSDSVERYLLGTDSYSGHRSANTRSGIGLRSFLPPNRGCSCQMEYF